jgi:hypothetical protein
MKLEFGHELRNHEEERDVDAEELAEVDLRRVEEEAVADEDGGTGGEPAETARAVRVPEAGREAGVAVDFEIGGEREDGEGPERRGNELGEQRFQGRPPVGWMLEVESV